jgi:DNA-binding CsgD family transcriptional regulator
MRETPRIATTRDVYAAAMTATRGELRASLAARCERSATTQLALSAVTSLFECDVHGAICMLRKACSMKTATHDERAYTRDLLVMLYASAGDFPQARNVLGTASCVAKSPADVIASHRAAEAILLAADGNHILSRHAAQSAIEALNGQDSFTLRGRVLARCALAAYYRKDYAIAYEHALEASTVLEWHDAHAGAGMSYSIAASIAQEYMRDIQLGAELYSRMLRHATLAGHAALERAAIVGNMQLAAQRFDAPAVSAMRARLLRRLGSEQFQENYVLLIAETLRFGWSGQFDSAQASITAHASSGALSSEQVALCTALQAVISLGCGDEAEARRLVRQALRQTARYANGQPLHAVSVRRAARLLCVSLLFALGDNVRGRRALSRAYDPEQRLAAVLSSTPIDLDKCPETFRGYAQFINVAVEHALRKRPSHGLTPAELEVLRALPEGHSVHELSQYLGKSKHTVARQLESIYVKLNARNRAQAVHHAREFGLLT